MKSYLLPFVLLLVGCSGQPQPVDASVDTPSSDSHLGMDSSSDTVAPDDSRDSMDVAPTDTVRDDSTTVEDVAQDVAPDVTPPSGTFGASCMRNGDCESGLCLSIGRCSRTYTGPADCPPSANWSCSPLPGVGNLCQCMPSGAETCDGVDNDCNGQIDEAVVCPGAMQCLDGACACPPGMTCSGVCRNLSNDPTNCGACGVRCASGATCTAGACVCDGGGEPCAGVCTMTQSDPRNCGACGTRCGVGYQCMAGSCVCASGMLCGAACVDTSTDPRNCGACGTICPSGGSTCVGGVCTCGSGLTACGSSCRNLATDRDNCGSCGHVCPFSASCMGGACVCFDPTRTACGTNCLDAQNDDRNCGTCGNVCPTGNLCQAGHCVCPPERMCGGTCVNTTNDTLNCGSCGHVCEVRCDGRGFCSPTVLASGLGVTVSFLAIDSGTLYFTDSDLNRVMSLSTAPSSTPALVTMTTGGPRSIAVQGGNLYWLQQSGATQVTRRSLGTGATNVRIASTSSPAVMALDATSVYWVNNFNTLNRAPLGATDATPVVLATGTNITAVASDGTNVYYGDAGSNDIRRVPVGGGPSVIFAAGQTSPMSMILQGGYLYWATGPYGTSTGTIARQATGATVVEVLLSALVSPNALTTDGVTLYWSGVSSGTNVLFRMPLAGGTPQAFASTGGGTASLALDATYVYFASGGNIERVAR